MIAALTLNIQPDALGSRVPLEPGLSTPKVGTPAFADGGGKLERLVCGLEQQTVYGRVADEFQRLPIGARPACRDPIGRWRHGGQHQ